MYFVEYWV